MGSYKVTTEDVKKLREISGAGMADCKMALEQCNGNFEHCETFLKLKGLAVNCTDGKDLLYKFLKSIKEENNDEH